MKVDILNEIIELKAKQKELEEELNALKLKIREDEHIFIRMRQEELAREIAESWNPEHEGPILREEEEVHLHEREKIYN